MVGFRSVVALAIGAWLLLGLAVALAAFSVGDVDTTFTPWPTKVAFDWLKSVPAVYRFIVAGLLGCLGAAMAVTTVRRYRDL